MLVLERLGHAKPHSTAYCTSTSISDASRYEHPSMVASVRDLPCRSGPTYALEKHLDKSKSSAPSNQARM